MLAPRLQDHLSIVAPASCARPDGSRDPRTGGRSLRPARAGREAGTARAGRPLPTAGRPGGGAGLARLRRCRSRVATATTERRGAGAGTICEWRGPASPARAPRRVPDSKRARASCERGGTGDWGEGGRGGELRGRPPGSGIAPSGTGSGALRPCGAGSRGEGAGWPRKGSVRALRSSVR